MIIIKILILALGFVMLMKGADWFVDGCSHLATALGIPQMIIGLTVVAMGTSMPEAAVSITAALKDTSDVAVGNIVGSNILNILIILGVTSLFIPIKVEEGFRKKDTPLLLGVTILLLAAGWTGKTISRWEGVLFLLIFLGYLLYLIRSTKVDKSNNSNLERTKAALLKDLLYILFGGILVVVGSDIAVDSATGIAEIMGMSEKFIGLTIVALGTSLPELVTSLVAAHKGNADIAIGNIVGSNTFNILFVLGVSSLIRPLAYPSVFMIDGMVALVAVLLFWGFALWKKSLSRVSGGLMLVVYAGYFVYLICKG